MSTKTLLLLRHAKSSWKDLSLDDHQRTLNGRGRDAATRVGRLVQEQQFAIDLVLCSTSTRTRETADRVFEGAKSKPPISYRDDLYHASPETMIQVLSHVAEPNQCVMLIGHNPGLEEFLSQLTGNETEFPTAGLAQIELDFDRWTQFNEQTRGRLVQFWRPKELDAD